MVTDEHNQRANNIILMIPRTAHENLINIAFII